MSLAFFLPQSIQGKYKGKKKETKRREKKTHTNLNNLSPQTSLKLGHLNNYCKIMISTVLLKTLLLRKSPLVHLRNNVYSLFLRKKGKDQNRLLYFAQYNVFTQSDSLFPYRSDANIVYDLLNISI